ncbi:uncharacterized protein PV06_04130 [Exophiala oligosperma]|uniref:FAD-binding FR-type domain-containing protein n=1 Tax=Exophiala oligosperma TaxID=215243 RepID=A0A0D2ECR7_9EURO|nr:uncharacterized protein PV06_04130 [Exophiala oligosperma]KIW45774.1 hypothetical protein PV06_04130 [Exophiala oligosperma]
MINVLIMAALSAKHQLFSLSSGATTAATSINLVIAVLIRQELIVNSLFWLLGRYPTSSPLRLRRLAAKVYHLGGVHSGTAIAATIWFGISNVTLFKSLSSISVKKDQITIQSITILLNILLVITIVTALPAFRTWAHDLFKIVHPHVRLADRSSELTVMDVVGASPVFWSLLLATFSIVLPWLRLRKVPVRSEPLSNHALQLHFTGEGLPLCAAVRLSTRPLLKWHAFATIPFDNGGGYSVIISNAGDWTARLLESLPTKLWIRGIPTIGVLHMASIFNKVVLVATGSGIGPLLSLTNHQHLIYRIIWLTPDPIATYSKPVMTKVREADPDAMIFNTTESGRPNLVRHVYRIYSMSGSEAVFLVSNPQTTRKVVYELESRGLPIFAPIFDS